MQVIFESRSADGDVMRDLSVDRVRFTLRRLSGAVARAKVLLTDVNGPRGGMDKRCQVEIRTDNAGTVVIASQESDWRTALETSLGRASRALKRSLRRTQKPVRDRTAKLSFDS